MELRPLLFAALALVPAYGGQLTQTVSCGAPTTVVTSLPVSSSNIFPPPLQFVLSNPRGQSIEAVANASEFHLETVADAQTWNLPLSLSSLVELEGRFLLSSVTPVTLAFWSACVTSTVSGPGLGTVTGTYGPFGIGSPCDFAQAQPLLPNNEIDELFALSAQGVPLSLEDVSINIRLNVFDAAPESSSSAVPSVPGGCRNRARHRISKMGSEGIAKIDTGTMRERLRQVYWIGGGSCGGKSTIARRLATQYGLHLYATDDAMADHSRRCAPEDCPLLYEFIAMDMDERWVHRSPATMLDSFHWFRGEAFHLIIEDLLRMPTSSRIVVEGFRLLPRLVKPLLTTSHHAVWLLPSPEFRQAAIEQRGGWAFLSKTSNPQRALQNLLERDGIFTNGLRKEVEELGLSALEINSGTAENDSVDRVAKIFGL